MRRFAAFATVMLLLFFSTGVGAGEPAGETEALRKQVQTLQNKVDALEKAGKPNICKEVEDYMATRGSGTMGQAQAVTVGTGKLQISGLLQVWYNAIHNDSRGVWGQANEGNDNDTFRIRRAEIALVGEIIPEVKYRIMFDVARGSPAAYAETSSEVLMDAYIDFSYIKWHTVRVGQFKPPVGREGPFFANSALMFPERAMLTRDPMMAAFRDVGAMVIGEFKETPVDWFTYYFGVFNGTGNFGELHQNRTDDNDAKDLVERLNIRVLGKQAAFLRDGEAGNLEIGFSRLDGEQGENQPAPSVAGGREVVDRYTMAIDLEYRYKMKEYGEFWLLAEYGEGSSRPTTTFLTPAGLVQSAHQKGWFVALAYKLNGTCNKHLDGKLEPCARYEEFDSVVRPGLVTPGHVDEFKTRIYEFGLNYYLKGNNAKIQASYAWVNDPNDRDQSGQPFREVRNDQFRLNFQVAF